MSTRLACLAVIDKTGIVAEAEETGEGRHVRFEWVTGQIRGKQRIDPTTPTMTVTTGQYRWRRRGALEPIVAVMGMQGYPACLY
jgi:hypothetical protein